MLYNSNNKLDFKLVHSSRTVGLHCIQNFGAFSPDDKKFGNRIYLIDRLRINKCQYGNLFVAQNHSLGACRRQERPTN